MQDPTRCKSAPCGCWTFRTDGYCSDQCAGIVLVTPARLRGIGVVSPPTVAPASRRKRVRRNDPTPTFAELQRDCRTLDRAQAAYDARVQRDLQRKRPYVTTGQNGKRKTVTPNTAPTPPRRIMAADLAPIGDANH